MLFGNFFRNIQKIKNGLHPSFGQSFALSTFPPGGRLGIRLINDAFPGRLGIRLIKRQISPKGRFGIRLNLF